MKMIIGKLIKMYNKKIQHLIYLERESKKTREREQKGIVNEIKALIIAETKCLINWKIVKEIIFYQSQNSYL